jgi:hypothetical protein
MFENLMGGPEGLAATSPEIARPPDAGDASAICWLLSRGPGRTGEALNAERRTTMA